MALLAGGIYLNAVKPLWLAPPLLEYTPLLYAALAYAWLPLFFYALTQIMTRRRVVLVLLVVFTACGQWFCWASVAPRREIMEMTAGMSLMSRRQCAYSRLASGQVYYGCEMRLESSDTAQVWVLQQKFNVWPGWPVLGLVESNFSIED